MLKYCVFSKQTSVLRHTPPLIIIRGMLAIQSLHTARAEKSCSGTTNMCN